MASLMVIGLAFGIWILWPRGDPVSNTTTTVDAVAVPTTVTLTIPRVSSSTSTTLGSDDHIVESVEEAETILRELWFGWFEGIYNEDEDRIREVVATEEQVATAHAAFGTEFDSEPTPAAISFVDTRILRSDEECLAVWTLMNLSDFRQGTTAGVNVLRFRDNVWVRLSLWSAENDLWEPDCASLLSS